MPAMTLDEYVTELSILILRCVGEMATAVSREDGCVFEQITSVPSRVRESS